MSEKSIQDKIKDATERARKNRDLHKKTGEEFNNIFPNHKGPLFGPRDDIEKAKQIKEIKESNDEQ